MKVLLVLILVSGCSVLGMQPLATPVPKDTYPLCTESISPAGTDLLLAGIGGIIMATMAVHHEDGITIAEAGAPTALFLGSGIYGVLARERCKTAREAADRTIQNPY